MVQVKSTVAGESSVNVKLSNWQRMVKDPLPWFFVHVVLDADAQPLQAHLIHVGEEWMSRVLERLRVGSSNAMRPLHEQTLALTWTDEQLLQQPFHTSMRAAILKAVGEPADYCARKATRLRTLGYDSRGNGRATIYTSLQRTKQDYELAVDFALGLVDRLPIHAFTLEKDVRFDVPAETEEHANLESAYMQFSTVPSVGTTVLTFANRKDARSLALPCETYIPTILFPRLPKEHLRYHFACPIASVVVNAQTLKMQIKWKLPEGNEPFPLRELAMAGELVSMFAKAEVGNEVVVGFDKNGKKVELGYSDAPSDFSVAVTELAEAVDHARFLAKWFELPEEILVEADSLRGQMYGLAALRGVLDVKTESFEIGLACAAHEALDGKRIAVMLPTWAQIGDRMVAAAVAYGGPVSHVPGEEVFRIRNGRAHVLGHWVVPLDDWKTFGFTRKVRGLAEKLETTNEYERIIKPSEPTVDGLAAKDYSAASLPLNLSPLPGEP